jgi:uncharacterized membrane protein
MQPPRQKTIIKNFVILAALTLLTGWILSTPPGLFGKVDAVGYAVCHRISERSFHIGDRQLPLCARCSGMYLGAVVGLAYQAWRFKKRGGMPHWSVLVLLGLFVVAFGVDGTNSYLYLIKEYYPGALEKIPNIYVPNNALRLLTGSGMGLGIAAMILPAFNSTIWADVDEHRVFPNLFSFAPVLGLMLILDLLVMTESPIILYPVAFISAGGVLGLLSMVYAMVWAMLMRQENVFTRLPQMWLVLLAGFTIALIQVAAIDILRFSLTGTWGAFPLQGQ